MNKQIEGLEDPVAKIAVQCRTNKTNTNTQHTNTINLVAYVNEL